MPDKEPYKIDYYHATLDSWPERIQFRASNPMGSYKLVYKLEKAELLEYSTCPLD